MRVGEGGVEYKEAGDFKNLNAKVYPLPDRQRKLMSGSGQVRSGQNRTEQNRTEQNRTEQNRTEQNRFLFLLKKITQPSTPRVERKFGKTDRIGAR